MSEATSQVTTKVQRGNDAFLWVFLLWFVSACTFVVLVGVLSSIRVATAAALVSAGTAALLPILLVLLGVALILYFVAIVILVGLMEAVPPVDEAIGWRVVLIGWRSAGRYYTWLSHRDRVWFQGAVSGTLVGVGVLFAIITLYVIPREGSTALTLIEVGERMQRIQELNGEFPKPDAQRRLTWESIELPEETNPRRGFVTDAFGRTIEAEVVPFEQKLGLELNFFSENKPRVYRPGEFERFTLRSHGFGRAVQSDDIVHTGVWSKAEPVISESVLGAFGNLMLQKGRASLSDRIDALRELRSKEEGASDNETPDE